MTCIDCREEKNIETKTEGTTCSNCKKWLEECEAVSLLKLPLHERRGALYERQQKRTAAAVERLKQKMILLYRK